MDGRAHLCLAKAYHATGKVYDALSHAEKYAKSDIELLFIYETIRFIYLDLGEEDKAKFYGIKYFDIWDKLEKNIKKRRKHDDY